jgi:mannose-6-phosphate isomerase-like protein (cupin superfamily)
MTNVHRVSLAGNLNCGHNVFSTRTLQKEAKTWNRRFKSSNWIIMAMHAVSALPRRLRHSICVGRIADMHLASTAPGTVRGNHYHVRKREAVIILPGAAWSLHWDEGENTLAQHRSFDGAGAVLVLASPGSSHAVRNDGPAPLWLVACSSEPYDPATVVARKVV